jgi:integrase
LLKFAKAKGYLDKDHPGVTLIEKASHVDKEVLVFTPEEITALLNGAKRELVPALAIGAFAGVRSQELKRLGWDNIRLREGYIEITSASSKTRIRRLIPIQRNLKAWLLPLSRDCGPVTPFANLALQFAKLARKTGVQWKKNGLRHSFISYRVGQINDVAAVSLEAGNSPQVVARHYLKCVTGAASRAWFNVMPHPGVAKHPKAISVQQPR